MISRIFSGAALLFALVTSLATSNPSFERNFAVGTYLVKSDCPNAQAEGEMLIERDSSAEPATRESYRLINGIAYGFPSNTLLEGRVRDSDLSGTATVQDGERECKVLLWETEANSGLFACYRGEQLECTIHLQKI